MAGIYNFTIKQGEDFTRTITWKDNGDNPVDITGYTAILEAKVNYNDTTAVLTITDTTGLTLGGTAGTIIISIPAATANALTFKYARYDLNLINPSDSPHNLLTGEITVERTAIS